ncbi:methylmalonyl-CoA mutase family protein [uncultured Rikenella sp.]|uniref:methylmalonyl-CoA mutase family protein n=1 Tax=uncultured Rikenella sp. TaxID=368003 RepID=UPI0026100988|nr:methylmalonyl-CoA mutase family protein [uncultured Rikenella sp.]
MAEEKATKLMAEFPPVTTEAWEEVIAKDLKGADRTKKLVWRTLEGFNVEPYYRADDMADLKHLGTRPGEFPYVRGVKADNRWRVRQTIEVGDDPAAANREAHDVLMKGVDSLGFVIKNKEFSASDLDTLLKGITITAVELAFSGCGVYRAAELFLDKIVAEKLDPEQVFAVFGIDPLMKLSKKGSWGCSAPDGAKQFGRIRELLDRAPQYKRIRMMTVHGTLFHNCGASAVQELAFALSMGHEYVVRLTDLGMDVDRVAPAIKFDFAVGTNYFMEIAKLRAARLLWANIMKPYNPKRGCSSKLRAHIQTSAWNQTVYDPYVNMLRGTTEAMSAAVAGVDSIEVLPFDHAYEQPTEFSSRIARNVQLLLKEESHFDQVTDPAAGSYYIEELTASIAAEAWKLFLAVEDLGGYTAAFEAGFIQDRVEETANKRDHNIATRREALLGTNQFPNFNETAPAEITAETVTRGAKRCHCGCKHADREPEYRPLRPYRGAMAFEAMRLRTDRSGKEPKAFMLTCGTLAMARARAQFACNFFACAGIRVIDNTFFASVAEGVEAAKASGARIVVVCSSDDDYATLAPEVFEAFRGTDVIVVVAGAPACQPELEAAGISHFISVRSNVLETLEGYLKELGI